jgi:hypothetical protein
MSGKTHGELVRAGLRDKFDYRGLTPETWCCIDCGVNTAPGFPNRVETENFFRAKEKAGVLWTGPDGQELKFNKHAEVYTVRDAVWKAAGMEPMGGCLCIGCLEKRIGRKLRPKDFLRNHPFNYDNIPCTERLRSKRTKNSP